MNRTAAVTLGPELTVHHAADLHRVLVEAVATGSGGDLHIDLQAVHSVDSAGVQLLLSTRSSLARSGGRLHIDATSAALREVLQTYGLVETFAIDTTPPCLTPA